MGSLHGDITTSMQVCVPDWVLEVVIAAPPDVAEIWKVLAVISGILHVLKAGCR